MRHQVARWTLKGLAAAVLAASLSACNMVITSEPMFTAEENVTPPLREGLWVNDEKDCAFDIKAPATSWPECAHWVVIKGSTMTGPDDKGGAFSFPFVLTASDPRVMQIKVEDEKKASIYVYMGIRPLKSDKQGNIVAYKGWLVQCGPPPPKDAKRPDGNPRYGTLEPSPGIIMDEDLSGCTPKDKPSLAGAAKVSEAWDISDNGGGGARWVRDGDQ